MEKIQIEKLWKISNSLDDYLRDIVFSNESRGEDITKIKSMQKQLDEVVDYVNSKYIIHELS